MEQEIQTAQEVSRDVCFPAALQNVLRLPVWRIAHAEHLRHGQSGDDHLVNLADLELYPIVPAFLPAVERYTAHRQG